VALNTNPPSPNPSIASFSALPIGTKLQEYEITGVLGEGGFGIVYLAHDKQLDREIAIKEYMPASLASRGPNGAVVVRSGHHGATFQAGRQSFITEAKLLAKFKHTALVEIFRFWEENGTAYMAMPFYRGQTLKQYLRDKSFIVDERWLRAFLAPLLDALEHLHEIHCYHRDISPDNILILENGQPLLLDFGAARRIIGDLTQALTVILKPGYAPVEQYADDSTIKQGPWTDIYGMAAVCFFAIKRAAPPAAVTRMMRDPMVALVTQAPEGFTLGFLAAIDGALKVKPEERPQSVQVFREMLGLSTYHADTRASAQANFLQQPQLAQVSSVNTPVTSSELASKLAEAGSRAAALSVAAAPVAVKPTLAPPVDDDGPTLILSSHESQRTFAKPTPAPTPAPTAAKIVAATPAPTAKNIAKQAAVVETKVTAPSPPPTQPPTPAPTLKLTSAPSPTPLPTTRPTPPPTSPPPTVTATPTPSAASLPKADPVPVKVASEPKVKNPLSKGLMVAIGGIGAVVVAAALWMFNAGSSSEAPQIAVTPSANSSQTPAEAPKTEPGRQNTENAITPIAPVLDIAKEAAPSAPPVVEVKAPVIPPPSETVAAKTPDPTVIFGPEIDKATEERLRIEKEAADKLAATIGFVKLDVQPWGNVVVNGARRAVSPPVKRLALPAGEYKIEISNPGFPDYLATVNVTAKETVVVTHRFQ
jgi:non-specific serine/threonine protein kinase